MNLRKMILTAIMALTVGTVVNAQVFKGTTPFAQVGVSSGIAKVINLDAEVGAQAGNNRVSVVGQTFDSNENVDRRYLVGIKYLRLIPIFANLQGTASLTGKTRTDNTALYVIEPGVGLNANFSNGLSLVAGVSTPISQASSFRNRTTLAGNLGLKFNL